MKYDSDNQRVHRISSVIKKEVAQIIQNEINDPRIKEELKSLTQEAHNKEIFGAPTFVVNNKIFWGQDRLEFALDEYNK
jgi:2-hydroxychromene-2-carboxylate isomerase